MAAATRPAASLTTEAGEEDDPGHVEVPLTAYVPVQVSPRKSARSRAPLASVTG